jgi:hypothetical protein
MMVIIAQVTMAWVVVGEPFVVADGTAVFGDPGDGPLHHRSERAAGRGRWTAKRTAAPPAAVAGCGP